MYRFLLFAFFIVSINATAQDFHGGLILGVAGSQIDGDNHRGYFKGGLNLGAYVNRKLNDNFGFQLEVKYTGKGAKSLDSLSMYKVSLKYVELPVVFFNEFNQKFTFQYGLSAGYLFKGWYSGYEMDDPSLSSYYDEDITANLSKFDICGLVGITYLFNERMTFSLRLSRSITPVYHIEGGGAARFWYRNTYNNTLAFAIYYRLGT